MDRLNNYVLPVLLSLFLFFGSVFFATKSFGATPGQAIAAIAAPPPGSFNGILSQNFQCTHEKETDVVAALGEGIVFRGPALRAFLNSLRDISGQEAPDMTHMRVYKPEPEKYGNKTWLLVAFKDGCVQGAAHLPDEMMNQLLRRAKNDASS